MRIKRFSTVVHIEQKEAFKKYRSEVERLTEEIAFLVPGIERREFNKWDLDHKIPIRYGFNNDIHPLKMSCLSNLQVIPHEENFKKNQKILYPLSILDQHDSIQTKLQEG